MSYRRNGSGTGRCPQRRARNLSAIQLAYVQAPFRASEDNGQG